MFFGGMFGVILLFYSFRGWGVGCVCVCVGGGGVTVEWEHTTFITMNA